MVSSPLCIIQARLVSERLPQKMLLPVMGKPLLWWAWRRAGQVFGWQHVVIVCPAVDGPVLEDVVPGAIWARYPGEVWDVLGRLHWVAHRWRSEPDDLIARVTPDDWPIQPYREWVTLAHLDHLQATIPADDRERREHIGHLFGANAPNEINTPEDYEALLRSYGEERR